MKKVTEKQLRLVIDELNALLFDPKKPQIPTEGGMEEIAEIIHQAVDILEPGDPLSDDLIGIIDQTSLGTMVFTTKAQTDEEDNITKEPEEISMRDLFKERTNIPLSPIEEPKSEQDENPEENIEQEESTATEAEGSQDNGLEEDSDGPRPEIKDEPEPEPKPKKPTPKPKKEKLIPEPKKEKLTPVPRKEKLAPAPVVEKQSEQPAFEIDYIKIADELRRQDLVRKRSRSKWERGKSPYSISIRLACKNPDIELTELKELVVEETGLEFTKEIDQNVRTALSSVRSVVRYLRENGLMPEKD